MSNAIIKFTWEQSLTQIAFSDTLIYKDGCKLGAKVYHKTTDNKYNLNYRSAHPKGLKDSIHSSLLIKSKRICTKEADFETEANMILATLEMRKYLPEILNKTFEKQNKKPEMNYSNLNQQVRTENFIYYSLQYKQPNNERDNQTSRRLTQIQQEICY